SASACTSAATTAVAAARTVAMPAIGRSRRTRGTERISITPSVCHPSRSPQEADQSDLPEAVYASILLHMAGPLHDQSVHIGSNLGADASDATAAAAWLSGWTNGQGALYQRLAEA